MLLSLSVFSASQMLNSGDNEIKHNATAFTGIKPEHYYEAEFSGNQALSYQKYIAT